MRHLLISAAFAALTAGLAAAADTRFSSVVEDLPLMDGLVETAAAPFETAQGRIVRIEAEGAAAPASVRRYYEDALPALGWTRVGSDDLRFRRGGEALEIRLGGGAPLRVTFVITPVAATASP